MTSKSGGLDLDACIYGLRNLSVGDDEQTRIDDALDDIPDLTLRLEVDKLVAAAEYEDAYELAIKPTLTALSRDEVKKATIEWVRGFIVEDDVDPTELEDFRERQIVDLIDEIMNEYERLKTKWWTPSNPLVKPVGVEFVEEAPSIDIVRLLAVLRGAQDRGLSKPVARFLAWDLRDLRLALAGPRSAFPEGLEVRHGSILIGTVLPNAFVIGALAKDRRMLDTLVAIGEAPFVAAKIYADLTGRCSFCERSLEDVRLAKPGFHALCASWFGYVPKDETS